MKKLIILISLACGLALQASATNYPYRCAPRFRPHPRVAIVAAPVILAPAVMLPGPMVGRMHPMRHAGIRRHHMHHMGPHPMHNMPVR